MNDEEGYPAIHRAVEIPARFIRQAYEHIEHSHSPYVALLFANERIAEAVCVGVSTRRSLPPPVKALPAPAPTTHTMQTLTEDVVLDVIRQAGLIDTQRIGDALGIAGNNIPLRQRIRRVLRKLTESKTIRKSGDKHFPKYSLTGVAPEPVERKMPLRTNRTITRKHITEEGVLRMLQSGAMTSRDIGDKLGIPRSDSLVRSKITEIVGKLAKKNQISRSGINNGRLYQIIQHMQTSSG